MAMFGFNNNMFGNRRSLTPNRSAMAINPPAGVNSQSLGQPKFGVRPTGFPFPTPAITPRTGPPQMPDGMNAFEPDAPPRMLEGPDLMSSGPRQMPNGMDAFQSPDGRNGDGTTFPKNGSGGVGFNLTTTLGRMNQEQERIGRLKPPPFISNSFDRSGPVRQSSNPLNRGGLPLPGFGLMPLETAMFSPAYNNGRARGPIRNQEGVSPITYPDYSQPSYTPSQSRVRGMGSGPLGSPMVGPSAPALSRSNLIDDNTPSIRQSTLDQFDQTDRAMLGMEGMVQRLIPGAQNIRRQQQSLAQNLNRPVERNRIIAAGGNPVINPDLLNPANPNGFVPNRMGGLSPRIDTSEAANVLRGQAPGTNTAMRPLNIPGMVFDEANGRMIPQSMVPRKSTANEPNAGLGGMSTNQFLAAQEGKFTGPLNETAGGILRRQQAVANSDVLDGKQYSPADWQARAERQSLRRAFTSRGGRGRAGFNQFVNNYYNQNGGSSYFNDQFGPGDRQASQQAAYRILRPGAVDRFGRIGGIGAKGMSLPQNPNSFARQQQQAMAEEVNPAPTTLAPATQDEFEFSPPIPGMSKNMPVQGFFRRPSYPGVRGNRIFPG